MENVHAEMLTLVILIMVAGMLTASRGGLGTWWLRSTFSQMLMDPNQFSEGTMKYIQNRYMVRIGDLHKMYVPICIGRHWFLMVVDMHDRTLVYLDSLKSNDHRASRVALMDNLAKQIQDMVCADKHDKHDVFRANGKKIANIANFGIHEPKTGQQGPFTNDYGVWVCEWMRTSHLWRNYDLQGISESTRMALAVDLVMTEDNPLGIVISRKAVKYWDDQMWEAVTGMPRQHTSGSTSTSI
ncbi:hypothetical protein PIB30_104076 [Stylosanthes scabra]|uniref:Ubiquitin-like protease family profile domain-containing protein n=1 Tax=Stylosanthes scabra TaxID=79078 RepID=A0ABU6ZWR5_9FABA|nr:hypothetical protein [Stylosanthes scabra]